ncbi:hypothetical protein D3C78_1811430 [compost metagenome]
MSLCLPLLRAVFCTPILPIRPWRFWLCMITPIEPVKVEGLATIVSAAQAT